MLPEKRHLKAPFLHVLLGAGRMFPRPAPSAIPLSDIRRILVFQDGGIGDMLRAFPLLQILRKRLPDSEISFLRTQRPDVSALLPADALPCEQLLLDMSGGYASKLREIQRLKRRRFDLLIGPSRGDGVLECATMGWLMDIPYRVGFDSRGSGFLYTHSVPFDEQVSILTQNVGLLGVLGWDDLVDNLNLDLPSADSRFAEEFLAPFAAEGETVICSHIWAISHSEFRSWDTKRYARLFRHLAEDHRCRILLLGSPSESPMATALASLVGHERLTDLTGKLTLTQSAALIRKCDGFIGNDSSMLHIANAWEVPSLAFFGATDPGQVLPPRHRCTPIRSTRDLPCRPCYRHQPVFAYRCGHGFDCLASISFDDVAGHLPDWLRNVRLRATAQSSTGTAPGR